MSRLGLLGPVPALRGVLALAVLWSAACGESREPDTRAAAEAASGAAADERAPNEFLVRFETTRGDFTVAVSREWAPLGVDRFHALVMSGYFDDVRFFRVIGSFMAQFGLHGDPKVNAVWERRAIPDDSVTQSNLRGMLTFATAGPDTRANQLFINTVNNRQLDEMGFAPIGRVVSGMSVVDSLFADYGDAPPAGFGPEQSRIVREGNAYLEKEFPKLDYIHSARIVADTTAVSAPSAGPASARPAARRSR